MTTRTKVPIDDGTLQRMKTVLMDHEQAATTLAMNLREMRLDLGGLEVSNANTADLLPHLKAMVDLFERRITGRPGPDDAAEKWDAARDAIAKAEGGGE